MLTTEQRSQDLLQSFKIPIESLPSDSYKDAVLQSVSTQTSRNLIWTLGSEIHPQHRLGSTTQGMLLKSKQTYISDCNTVRWTGKLRPSSYLGVQLPKMCCQLGIGMKLTPVQNHNVHTR